ncbi:MAG: hypothetical protein R3C25_03355 [Hyphomonadaceae bacterium]
MSLNKTLDRLFDEIRREAKRNPDFANRIDAVLQRHESRRDVPADVLDDVGRDEAAPAPKKGASAKAAPTGKGAAAGAINPAGLYKKSGEEGLSKALANQDLSALRALVAEHNLDPSGVTSALTRDELAAHILAQAKRRAERDEKMFDY